MVVTCLVIGLLLGVLTSLTPALMLATLLSLVLSSGLKELMGGVNVAVMATAALGASLYTRRVGMLLNPVGVNPNLLASLDPALRMAHSGKADLALKIMVKATTLAIIPTMGMIVCLTYANHVVPLVTASLLKAISVVVPLAIMIWVLHLVWRAKNKVGTITGLIACGAVGYTTFQSSLSGVENSIVVLMFAMFTLPMALWTEQTTACLRLSEGPDEKETEVVVGWMGIPIGLVAGTLPGLGNSSIVSMFEHTLDSDERYVSVSTAAEVSAEVLGVFLVLATGMARSGEAVQIASSLKGVGANTALIALLLCTLTIGIIVSHMSLPLVVRLGNRVLGQIPTRALVATGVVIGLAQVLVVGCNSSEWPLIAATTGSAFLVALGIRILKLPNQVAFGMLSLPVLVMYL